jgi:hypothetical protein
MSIASKHYAGNETFTGIACDIDDRNYVAAILASPPGEAPMRDVSVYLWNDVDGDGFADGYTVTTGSFTWGPEDIPSFTGPPLDENINYGPRWLLFAQQLGLRFVVTQERPATVTSSVTSKCNSRCTPVRAHSVEIDN